MHAFYRLPRNFLCFFIFSYDDVVNFRHTEHLTLIHGTLNPCLSVHLFLGKRSFSAINSELEKLL